jgi:hypothetical protein
MKGSALACLLLFAQIDTHADWSDQFPVPVQKKLKDLLAEAQSCKKLPVEFGHEPNTNISHMEITSDKVVIQVRGGLPVKVAENAFAHEIYHIILECNGYSNRIVIPNRVEGTTVDNVTALAASITSCVDDPVVDAELKKRGFSPEILNHESANLLRKNQHSFPPEYLADKDTMVYNGLAVYCSSFRLRYRSDNIEDLWSTISPPVVEYAHLLESKVGSLRCGTPATCFEKKKRLRDALGYPIGLRNSDGGKIE